jgi:hypothetical protein
MIPGVRYTPDPIAITSHHSTFSFHYLVFETPFERGLARGPGHGYGYACMYGVKSPTSRWLSEVGACFFDIAVGFTVA